MQQQYQGSNGIISSLGVDVSPLLRALRNVLAKLYIVGLVALVLNFGLGYSLSIWLTHPRPTCNSLTKQYQSLRDELPPSSTW
jgi:hypothetical protein